MCRVPCMFKCPFPCTCVIDQLGMCAPVKASELACTYVCMQRCASDSCPWMQVCLRVHVYVMCVQLQKCVCTRLAACTRGELKVKIGKMKTHGLPSSWCRCQFPDFENVLELCKMILLGRKLAGGYKRPSVLFLQLPVEPIII